MLILVVIWETIHSNKNKNYGFNNYVDRILPIFDTPLCVDSFHTLSMDKMQKQTFFRPPPPTSSCPRSYWMPPMQKGKKEEKVILWIHNDKAGRPAAGYMYVWVNPSFVDVRIRGCASVFHAGHVGNVLRPSIAFRQWLGSEYPQITTAGRNARAASSLGQPGPAQPCF